MIDAGQHPFPPAPQLVKTCKAVRMVDPARLTQAQRRWLWLGIQALDPALAALLSADAGIDAVKQAFNATVRFSAADAARFTEAGQKITEVKTS